MEARANKVTFIAVSVRRRRRWGKKDVKRVARAEVGGAEPGPNLEREGGRSKNNSIL